MKFSLLFIDDDKDLLKVNSSYFGKLGYKVVVSLDAADALRQLKTFRPDCIVMDVMMPGKDGFAALPDIREATSAPVIFLTGRDSEDDKIRGLMLGADDYMVKPYSFREMEARILTVIRRYRVTVPENNDILTYGDLSIDQLAHKICYRDEELNLSNKEYMLLQMLIIEAGKEFTFEEIGNNLWGTYLPSDRKTIMVTASRLRKKLALYPGLENCVETVWSKGYRFRK